MTSFRASAWRSSLLLTFLIFLAVNVRAQNQIQGRVEFAAKAKAQRSAGVWIDGQYVGYVDELRADNTVFLLPGPHEISLRLAGYRDQTLNVNVQPKKRLVVKVKLERDPRVQYSELTAEVKLEITPSRAAVFLDDAFAGHAGEFGGVGRGMLIRPGKHHIRIALAGYQTFETDVDLAPNQKTEIKTELVKSSAPQPSASNKSPRADPHESQRANEVLSGREFSETCLTTANAGRPESEPSMEVML
jgi:hypothetical protein